MSNNTNPTCPTGCEFPLPSNTFDFCQSEIHTGEIEILYLAAPEAQCFTDLTSLVEWNARISATSTDPDAIRRFRVIGDMPAGTSEGVDISLGQKYFGEKEFTANIEIEDNSDLNYELMRAMECNHTVKAWLQTAGGDLFGDICGIEANVMVANVIERGQNSIHKQMWTLTWKAKHSPVRVTSPLA